MLTAACLHADNTLHLWRVFLDGNELMREYKAGKQADAAVFLTTKGYELMQDFPVENRQIWGKRLKKPQYNQAFVYITTNGACRHCELYHMDKETGEKKQLPPWCELPYFDSRSKQLLNPAQVDVNAPMEERIQIVNNFWVHKAGYKHCNTVINDNGLICLEYERELKWSIDAVLVRFGNGTCTELRRVYAQDYYTKPER